MSQGTLYDKVFDSHVVDKLPTGQYQLIIGLHLVHDVTSSPAFEMLRGRNGKVLFPDRTYATADHMIPTKSLQRPFADFKAESLMRALEKNADKYGITFFGPESGLNGIVHVIGPELGLTQPGMTIACGDSHTSTHGAFGSLAFGIGSTEIAYILETQTLPVSKLNVRRIDFDGALSKGVYAKDVVLAIINGLGVSGGKGFAYEFNGSTIKNMSMEQRMTLCNMSIEGGALVGYVNPDENTFDYLDGRKFSPKGNNFERAIRYWKSIASDSNAQYDDHVKFNAITLEPMVTWGTNPGQSIAISQRMPQLEELAESERGSAKKAYDHMRFTPGDPIYGTPISVAFIGSCTNSRISDLREAAKIFEIYGVADGVTALVVPGSNSVKIQAEKEGLDRIFKGAGAEWREAGCSMCLAMNPDKLIGDQISASSSNRNFVGRQGSPQGRTLLMSPAMVAAAAVKGYVNDVRELL